MRIGLTGGGTGGHFYPLIAVASELRKQHSPQELGLFYFGEDTYDEKSLQENNISFIKVSAGKKRTYASILNFTDYFKVAWGIVQAMFKLAVVYPDVIFSKGGYVAFPVLVAARILRVPVVIHDSDIVPGRTSVYSAKFAKYVCTAWKEGAAYFIERLGVSPDRIIYTGLPLRKEINPKESVGVIGTTFAGLSNRVPTILIIGGSQGSETINDAILKSLGVLLQHVQIIHQTGKDNYERVKKLSENLLQNTPEAQFYIPVGHISQEDLRFLFSKILLTVSRSGSGVLEFFAWGIPSILVPITNSNGDHQRQNAYAAMRAGASIVIEEKNLTAKILENEILRLLKDSEALSNMVISSRKEAKYDGAKAISEVLLHITNNHY
jgi:UDP-N-acetylglucosamine--N-acetylmuramyl-(pentapeptide) pyrophosphoryl-undecaprenol N-acetylglucosamine transferase